MVPHESVDAEVAELREDHWKLAILFQRLSEGFTNGQDQQLLRRILESMALFFEEHSGREEAYLARANPAGLVQHKQEHALASAVLRSVLDAAKLGRPLARADIDAISTLFTDILFVADGRDIAGIGSNRLRVPDSD